MVGDVTEKCLFCRVIMRQIESHIVFEDEISVAILDHRPLFPGHCLLIPKAHHETLTDVPAALIAPLFSNLQLLVYAVERGLEADGSFVAVNNRVSQSVPHVHIHVVPRRKKDGLKGFFWPRRRYRSKEEILQVQTALQSVIQRFRAEQGAT